MSVLYSVPIPTPDEPAQFVCYVHQAFRPDENRWRETYCGVCLLDQLMMPPDALQNSMWRELAQRYPQIVAQVITIADTQDEAEQARASVLARGNMPANEFARPVIAGRSKGRVRCNETGETFDNAAHACRVMGCNITQMSNHLRGAPGYVTVRGRTFRRIG